MFPLTYLSQSPTTQIDVLKNINTLNTAAGLYTFNQTQGKGQYGNTWLMPDLLNIAYSFALKETAVHLPTNSFNFHTALVVRDFLANLTSEEVFIKWPNDIIIHRKKISGMLIEKVKHEDAMYYVFGVGINVLQENFTDLSKAGSLLTQTSKRFDLHSVAESLHEKVSKEFTKQNFSHDLVKAYNDVLFCKGSVALFAKNGIRQNGIIQEVDSDGFLWIDLEQDGVQRFFHKEIEMLY